LPPKRRSRRDGAGVKFFDRLQSLEFDIDVDMNVDGARQEIHPGRVDYPCRWPEIEPDFGHHAVVDADIRCVAEFSRYNGSVP
jgi:hypothetical protein